MNPTYWNAKAFPEKLPGLLLSLLLAAGAWFLGEVIPVVGAPVLAILFGVALTAWRAPGAQWKPGIRWASRSVLQIAIVPMGFGLSFQQVWRTGRESLVVMLGTLSACLLAAWVIGPALGISRRLTALIGAGTAICGASAIAAVAPVVEAEEQEVAYAISTIFLFNLVAVLLFPPLGHVLGLVQHAFGLWAGTAINDTSSVVAAAYAYGKEAGDYATVVKLSRALMIVPVTLLFSILVARQRGEGAAQVKITKLVPPFIIGFVAASLLVSTGWVPTLVSAYLPKVAKFLIVVALAAVGLGSDVRALAKTGPKPLLLGLVLWVLVASLSLLLQHLAGER
jgi:uncharacterized integral membrane protein (TIGR00698 family)